MIPKPKVLLVRIEISNALDRMAKEITRDYSDKPSRRRIPVPIGYLGFTVPNKFIIGYGIDFDENYPYLPDMCVLED